MSASLTIMRLPPVRCKERIRELYFRSHRKADDGSLVRHLPLRTAACTGPTRQQDRYQKKDDRTYRISGRAGKTDWAGYLATLLWPFSTQTAARGNLRTAIHEAAKVLPNHAIRSVSDTVELSRSHVTVDVWRFAEKTACLTETPPPLDDLLTAANTCRGEFLEGFSLPD